MSAMDPDVKKNADTLFEHANMESADAVRADKQSAAHRRALFNKGTLPISGVDIERELQIYEAHIERCMNARLNSYQRAYSETNRTPSEQDFGNILKECKEVWDLAVKSSTRALRQFAGSQSPIGEPVIETMVKGSAGHGHDRVLLKFKVWKAKAQLKPSSAKAAEREKQRDVLVPTYNRAEFEFDLPNLTPQSGEKRPCSLLFLDIDKFKFINDTLLHAAGDRVLKTCADVLLRVCEGKGSVYRYGGDEFCVLLPNHSLEEAVAVAGRILREARAIRSEELPDGLSTSIGAACFPESAGDHTELLSRADEAMYVSKKAGGNQVSKACPGQEKREDSASRLKVWERL
jgi:diguanylate cyclase (GGDEF)-like protein